jgi:S-adenosylmethionine:tRNA ribosyltransferase-isomerase
MNAAIWPRRMPNLERLLVMDRRGASLRDAHIKDLPGLLKPGDLLILNDAATLPASLLVNAQLEIRLARFLGPNRYDAVLFGAGSWRDDTDERPIPPALAVGDTLDLSEALNATVEAVSPISRRLVTLHFNLSGHDLVRAIFSLGRPVQYSYLAAELKTEQVQSPFAGRPVAMEMPSAGRPLSQKILARLRRRNVAVATLTHGAGLSATGDPELDAALPLPEPYWIPQQTLDALARCRQRGGRVIAAGTTVTRALEGAFINGQGLLNAGAGITDLRIDHRHALKVVDGILTGMHAPSESHFELLEAFAERKALSAAFEHAKARGYVGHEFGDSGLILPA